MQLFSYLGEHFQHHVPGVPRERHPGAPLQATKILNISVNSHHRTFEICNKDPTMQLFSYLGEHFQHHVPGVPREHHPEGPLQATKIVNIS